MTTPTPHNEAVLGQIAKTVLLPGDPLRAKVLAETYLENPVQYNGVRGMLGYTGTYRGKQVSVQGSGMGCPSMGIYSHELYQFYGVETIIRVGSAGAIDPGLHIGDLVIGQGSCTNSNFGQQFNLPGAFAPIGAFCRGRKWASLRWKWNRQPFTSTPPVLASRPCAFALFPIVPLPGRPPLPSSGKTVLQK